MNEDEEENEDEDDVTLAKMRTAGNALYTKGRE